MVAKTSLVVTGTPHTLRGILAVIHRYMETKEREFDDYSFSIEINGLSTEEANSIFDAR